MIKLPLEHEHHHPLTSEVRMASEPNQSPPIARVDSPKTVQTDNESTTIQSIVSSQQKVRRELSELIEDYKCEAEKMMLNHGYDPEKEASIRMRLSELQKEKQKRRQRFQKDLQRLKEKQKQLQQNKIEGVDVQQKRRSIEKKLQVIKQREKKRRQEEKEFNQFYRQFKTAKPRYQQKEEEFNQKEKQLLEDKKRKVLSTLKQRAKPIDQDQLSNFEQKYMENKEQAEEQRQHSLKMEKEKEQWQAKQLERLYKGSSHERVTEQLRERGQKSQSAYNHAKRIREYSQFVKEEYAPQTNSLPTEGQEESDEDPNKSRRVMKEKFLKGHYLGQVAQYPRSALSHQEQVQKGIGYLEYLKSLPKKARKQQQSAPPLPLRRQKVQVYRVRKDKDPLYQRKRYRSIDMSIGDISSADRVMGFMKDRGKKLQREQRLLKHERYHSRDDYEKKNRQFDSSLVGHIEEKLKVLNNMYG